MLKGFLFKILSVIFLLPIGLYGTTHYVNSTTGNDLWDGSSDTFVSGTVGPKVSITGGIAAATSGDTLNISGDFVTEPVINTKELVFDLQNAMRIGDFIQDCTTGGSIMQGKEATITSAFTFTNGILKAFNRVKVYPGAVMGSSATSSFFEGLLFLGKASTAAEKLVFAIGDQGNYREFEWEVTQSTADTNYYGVQLYNAEAPSLNYPTGINNKSYIHYWSTHYTGDAIPSNFKYGGNYDSQGDDDEVSDENNLRLLFANPSAVSYTNIGGVGTASTKGLITATSTVSDTGFITFGNAFGGLNKLGTNVPVINFSIDNRCIGIISKFSDLSFVSSGATLSNWLWNFGDTGTMDTSTIQNPSFTYVKEGVFTIKLIVTASNGNKDSISKTIAIGAKPLVSYSSKGACLGDTTVFTSTTSSSNPTLTYNWIYGDGNDTTSAAQVVKHLYSSAGNFTSKLIVSDTTGCIDSMSKSINIYGSPLVSYSAIGSCIGDSTVFTSSSSSSNQILDYNWVYGDGNSVTSDTQVVKHLYSSTGNFTTKLIVTDTSGCKDSTSLAIDIFEKPTSSATITGLCSVDSVSFAGTGVVVGDSITNWDWTVGTDNSTLQNFKIKYNASEMLSAKLVVTSSGGCKDSTTVTKQIWQSPEAIVYIDNSVPNNDSIQCLTGNFFTLLNASVYPFDQGFTVELLWGTNRVSDDNDFSFTTAGVHPVVMKIETDKGCADSLNLQYITNAPESVGLTIDAGCLNDSVSLIADLQSINSNRVANYNWTINRIGSITSKDTLRTLLNDSGSYTAKFWANLNDGCTDTANQIFRMELQPSIGIDTVGNIPFCPKDSVRINVTGGTTILWQDADVNYSRVFRSAQILAFEVSDASGCKSNDTIETILHSLPTVDAGMDTSIVRGNEVTLQASGGVKYKWTPIGSVDNEDSARTNAKPINTRKFFVLVTDTNGCSASDSVIVTVNLKVETKIQNLITPNGDLKNDVWDLSEISNIDKAKIRVFSAQGKLVFIKENGYFNDWQGTEVNGKELPTGPYLYIIEVPGESPKRGFIKILRK